ncbi:MAG: tetratricopeptide repeat protein [Fibrobacterota bacterium]
MAKIKLNRESVSENTFEKTADKAIDWMSQNKPLLAKTGITVLILLAAIKLFYLNPAAAKEQNSINLFGEGIISLSENNRQEAINSFTKILENYSSTDQAGKSAFLLGGIYYQAENYEEAASFYDKYLSSYKNGSFTDIAAYDGLGSSYQELGKISEALRAFEKGAAEFKGHPLTAGLMVKTARLYAEDGKKDKARELCEKVKKDFPKTEFLEEAETILASI